MRGNTETAIKMKRGNDDTITNTHCECKFCTEFIFRERTFFPHLLSLSHCKHTKQPELFSICIINAFHIVNTYRIANTFRLLVNYHEKTFATVILSAETIDIYSITHKSRLAINVYMAIVWSPLKCPI